MSLDDSTAPETAPATADGSGGAGRSAKTLVLGGLALALVVALLDLIPMIGATLGAVVVSLIALGTDPWLGLVSVIFYVVYQQLENYVIYPRVMSRAVDISGALIVIAALIGATLLGVVGALLAIPTAAALQLLVQELFLKRQDVR